MARGVRGEGRLDTILVVVCVTLAIFAMLVPQSSRERTAALLRSTILRPLVALQARSVAARSAVDSRSRMLDIEARFIAESLHKSSAYEENGSLRRLLGLAARLQDGFVPAEVLPARPGDEFTLSLSVGSNTGVQPFLPVVTADGLVGMIESVDASTSFAITWAHPDFRVSAMSSDERAFGIVQPHLGLGAERWLLELRGVPFRENLEPGALIVSSGLGGTYPRNIPVGTIMGEMVTPEKWARTYLVKPAVLPEAIGPVFVLVPARVEAGVAGVWTSVTAADSAARAVAAAGDSIARKAALDELAARRATLAARAADSIEALRLQSDTLRDSTAAARSPASAIPPGTPPATPPFTDPLFTPSRQPGMIQK